MAMEGHIIPFGKHKGKPVEVLASDQEYLQWLMDQHWFKEKYVNIYNVVVNNFREPVDTPEHNKIQVRFLNLKYRVKLAYLVNPELFKQNNTFLNDAMRRRLEITEKRENEYFLEALANPRPDSHIGPYDKYLFKYSDPVFESVDVTFALWYGMEFYYKNSYFHGNLSTFRHKNKSTYYIEIKPTISDDFPAILRQMKAAMPVRRNDYRSDYFYILLVGEYAGSGATKDEFVQYFESQGYQVVFENQIHEVSLPKADKTFVLDEDIQKKVDTFLSHGGNPME